MKQKLFLALRNSTLRSWVSGIRRIYSCYFKNYRKHMGYCDKTATVTFPLNISNPENVFLFEDTKLENATILTKNARFIVKKHSACTSGIRVVTGAHERRIGRFYRTITEAEKKKGLDADVIVEEDCWIGMNVTLLSGVTVGRGATIATGAVITRSIPPYSIWGGVPAKFIKFYWTIDEILQHEAALYPESERFTREQLEEYFAKYQK